MVEKPERRPAHVTTIALPKSSVKRIDGFRVERRLSSRTEAIRRNLRGPAAQLAKRGA
jgi:hypothetical protein